MGKRFDSVNEEHIRFIYAQKIFFVATAPVDGRLNLSPKGMDSFRVIDRNTIAWLNVTGSGNETATHIAENGRMTIMFCAFDGKPVILRLYGTARVLHPRDEQWSSWLARFNSLPGTRQIFIVKVDLVQSSCGMAVPLYDYVGERNALNEWAQKKGDSGIAEYWRERNQYSIDGRASGIIEPEE